MSLDLSALDSVHRLLFEIPLEPLQGHRFQPTGFPGLGPATFQTPVGRSLLVESAQSMANRLELTCWDEAQQNLKADVEGLSHVMVLRNGTFLTDSTLEAHRINSPYILKSKTDQAFFNLLKDSFGNQEQEVGPVNRRTFAEFLLTRDIGSLLHGVFLSQSELAGGRLRLARAFSAFIEADTVEVAPSGGVKNDHVHPGKVDGDKEGRFGNIPYARDEFTAQRITLYVNLDLAQIRGYGLGQEVERLLILLALYKLRALVDGGLRLRTACDFRVATDTIAATLPQGFNLPSQAELAGELKPAIKSCASRMTVTTVSFNDELKKGKEGEETPDADDPDATGD